MTTSRAVFTAGIWQRYLIGILVVLAAVSLVLPLLPSVGASAFSLLVYQDRAYPADFSPEALSYIRLTNAVLGSVMAGWFLTMLGIARRLGSDPALWRILAAGLAIWFVPDTAYSIGSGYWQNAILNVTVLALFVPPLVAHARQRATRPVRPPGSGDEQ